jgi:AcrR family transcriptional regulator
VRTWAGTARPRLLKTERDRNGIKRLQILKSAAAAFRHRGYYGASVEEIARALEMSKSNLYYYFRDKEEILFACHEYALDILLKMLRRVEKSPYSPEQRLRRVIVVFIHTMIDELGGTALTMDLQPLAPPRLKKIIAKRDRFDRGIRQIIARGIKTGAFRIVDAKLVTFAILGSINWISYWFDPGGDSNSVEIAEEFADYLLAGLVNRRREHRLRD